MEECEEPRCTKEANKVWGGRKVCRDHFESYKEAQDKMISDMRDF